MIVDINDNTRPECALNGTQYAWYIQHAPWMFLIYIIILYKIYIMPLCSFNLTACANYGGRGLTNTLSK